MTPEETGQYSSQVAMHLAALIILALIGVFVLHRLGFRFVLSGSVGASA